MTETKQEARIAPIHLGATCELESSAWLSLGGELKVSSTFIVCFVEILERSNRLRTVAIVSG